MTPQRAHHLGYQLGRAGFPARIPDEHLEAITNSDNSLFAFFEGHEQGRATKVGRSTQSATHPSVTGKVRRMSVERPEGEMR